jgi:CSLREA domain-containing protein
MSANRRPVSLKSARFDSRGSLQRWMRGLVAVAAVIAGVAWPAPTPALGKTPSLGAAITVTTTSDTLANDGQCSIREAIINANNDAATWPDCPAGAGDDTIILPAGTITFAIANPASSPANLDSEQHAAKGDLDILSSMTIVGDPAGTTIDANQLDRIFDINHDADGDPSTPTPSITVNINQLTMTNGRQNQSGAVRINARATVTMDRVTISSSNSWADDGGGIYVFADGALTLTNSTISGNQSLLLDGGIKNEGSLSVVNSTITNNHTSGITPNRGQGLGCSGLLCTIRNTIIAGNGAAPRGDIEGFITSLGYNIIGKTTNDTNSPIATITATTGDQFDVGAAAVALGPLANNGGPTPTHALGASSIAIDAGESSGATTDQLGNPRPCDLASVPNAAGGDGADIGAFEVQGACAPPNAPPIAVDDAATFEVNSGTHMINVLANDSDPDSDPLTITAVTQGAHGGVANNSSSVSYTPNTNFIGSDTFTYTIDDGHGHTATATVTITVVDTTPPVLTVSTTVSTLWPPNHDLQNVGLSVSATDNSGGTPSIQVVVFSNESDLAPDSGNFSPDAANIAPGTLRLRAERMGSGDGRVYLIVVTATDASSNVSHACVTVVVPQNQSAAALSTIAAQAAAASQYCEAHNGTPPPGFVPVGNGPVVGPKQ